MMKSTPRYPYQETVNQFTHLKKEVGIFVGYGGGKTYLSLNWLDGLVQHWGPEKVFPCLIFGTKSILWQWHNQTKQHSSYATTPIIGSSAKKRVNCFSADTEAFNMNYDAVKSKAVAAKISQMRFNSIIVDESVYLKEARTVRFKTIQRLLEYIPFRCILSGKPITEKQEELFGQMLFLDRGETFGRAYWSFKHRYFTPGPPWKPYDWELRPGADKAIAALCNKRCIRIPQEVVDAELPPKNYITVPFELPDKLRKIYKELKKDFQCELPSGDLFQTQWAVTKAQKLRQLCQGFFYKRDPSGTKLPAEHLECLKLDWLKENIPILLSDGSKILIWANFRESIKLIEGAIDAPCAVYHGEMSSDERRQAEDDIKSGKVSVMIVSEGAGNAGLDLWQVNKAIFYGTDYKAGWRANAEKRCHRSGSEIHDQVTFIDLVYTNTIDEVILKAIEVKENLADAILRHIRSS